MTLDIFSHRLSKENVDDALDALEKIAQREREEGENAIPEIGAILAEVKACGILRRDRERNTGKTFLARWRCPDCGVEIGGYITGGDSDTRYCHAIPQRPHAPGEICGGTMARIQREQVA